MSTVIIALRTATPVCELSLRHDDAWIDRDYEAGRTLARTLLSRINDVAEGDLSKITGIVAYAGPGSYTGLRIGLTVVNTLASSMKVPIVGVSGDDWREEGLRRLLANEDDVIVMPVYGGEPHITTPRK
ncbi:hypothetical protein CL689_04340 [Candidatus Saccharibacteria bacterium]|nr:hypothetical protein [Candidatus Saccharibacteria bacterium]MBJ58411.1 hypothetical protein [Candidatus Saccharibacteria bacterium]MBQ69273.1 hypothetical protein [Candidatus Saccharibacteria bacterium]